MEGGTTLTRRASWRRSQTVDETSNQSTLTRGRSLRAQLSNEEPATDCNSQSTLTRGRSLRAQLSNEEPGTECNSQSTLTRARSLRAQLSNEEPGNQSMSTLTRRSLKEGSRNSSESNRSVPATEDTGSQSTLARRRAVKDSANVLSEASRTLHEAMNSLLAQAQTNPYVKLINIYRIF